MAEPPEHPGRSDDACAAAAPAESTRTPLDAALRASCATGEAAFPGARLAPALFAEHLARHLPALATSEDPAALLAPVHVRDLWLACACAHGDPGAERSLEQRYLSRVPAYVSRLDSGAAFADEVAQLLREKLLVPRSGALPRLADYSGRGALDGFLRAAAVRTAISLLRTRAPAGDDAQAAEQALLLPQGDPELKYIQQRHRPEVQQAFEAALRGLSSKERNVLRLHYLDRLNIDAIGVMYGVHRATVNRWLVGYRGALLQRTRAELSLRLRLPDAELDSLLGLVQSQLEISLRDSGVVEP